MKAFLISLMILTPAAFATPNMKCATANDSDAMTYIPQDLGFQIEGQAEVTKVVGEIQVLPTDNEMESAFLYPLENGLSVKIVWINGETEVLRNIRAQAARMELRNQRGEVVESFTKCHWVN